MEPRTPGPLKHLNPSGPSDASPNGSGQSDLQIGAEVVRAAARSLPARPGVYQMEAADREVLYVGKARVLRNRVATYSSVQRLPIRLRRMIAQVRHIEFTVTEHEAEALLLEANRIKKLRPRYNILLRDDHSYPYIHLRTDHAWPQLLKHRGRKRRDGHYFGPFASVRAVNVSDNRTILANDLSSRKLHVLIAIIREPVLCFL